MIGEDLLYKDKDGHLTQFEEVVDDGLDRDYSDRYPALLELMQKGPPRERLLACSMLAAWGVPDAFEVIREWAANPEATPWAQSPVTFDRITGADAAFEQLADAIRTSFIVDRPEPIPSLRRAALVALLGSYHIHHFGRSMLFALAPHPDLIAALAPSIANAIRAAIDHAGKNTTDFDAATQAAALLGPLASVRDEDAADLARSLIAAAPANGRALREVAEALASGTGAATLSILQELASSPDPRLGEEARKALARRAERQRPIS